MRCFVKKPVLLRIRETGDLVMKSAWGGIFACFTGVLICSMTVSDSMFSLHGSASELLLRQECKWKNRHRRSKDAGIVQASRGQREG